VTAVVHDTGDGEREREIERLVGSEGPRLLAFASRFCGDRSEAEDLVQETFARAFRAWDQLDDPDKARPWLYTIARHACQRMHQRRAGEPEHLEPLDELLPRPAETVPDLDGVNDPHRDRLRSEARELVERGLAALPVDFRMPLLLADVAELTTAEIAAVLGLKEATVKTRIHRARLKLRAALAERLPQRPAPAADHSRELCLDLIRAKLEAYDRGVPFPYADQALCERCRSVLGTLDLAQECCAALTPACLPEALRARLAAASAGAA
jgi:RNA polymerase sigma-70 factor (ECF subfamily)